MDLQTWMMTLSAMNSPARTRFALAAHATGVSCHARSGEKPGQSTLAHAFSRKRTMQATSGATR